MPGRDHSRLEITQTQLPLFLGKSADGREGGSHAGELLFGAIKLMVLIV